MKKYIRLLIICILALVTCLSSAAGVFSVERQDSEPIEEVEMADESEKLQLLLAERQETAKPIMTSPSSNDPMNVIIILIAISGIALVAIAVISVILKKKK